MDSVEKKRAKTAPGSAPNLLAASREIIAITIAIISRGRLKAG
jgi:hypothetical protein